MFPDDSACVAYVERLRWPEGFVCPSCRVAAAPWRQTRGRLVCGACRHQASVTAGTIFDKTRTRLTTWFEAAWHVSTAKKAFRPRHSNKRWVRAIGRRGQCCSAFESPWYAPSETGCL